MVDGEECRGQFHQYMDELSFDEEARRQQIDKIAKNLLGEDSYQFMDSAQRPYSYDNIIFYADDGVYAWILIILGLEMVRFLLRTDNSISYFKRKRDEYKALSIPLAVQTICIYFLYQINEAMDDKKNYRLQIVNEYGQIREFLGGMMSMGLIWLYREYRWVNYFLSGSGSSTTDIKVTKRQESRLPPKVSDLENRITKVTTEKRNIVNATMVLIESMRSILDESNNLRIPITIPINEMRNEELILTNMKKLKQNVKKVCEATTGLVLANESGNPKNIVDENNLLKEANQNLKKELKATQREAKVTQKELKQKNQKVQSEVKELENNLACYNQHNSLLESELKNLKNGNRELSNRIKASTKAFNDLKFEHQQSLGRITAFGARLTSLEVENNELKVTLDKANAKLRSIKVDQSMASTKARIDALENSIRMLESENSRLREANECSICCEEVKPESNKKWEAFVPCGHRFCSKCSRNICSGLNGHNQRICPNCRTTVEKILTVYDT